MTTGGTSIQTLLSAVAKRAATAEVFGAVRVEGGVLRCDALASAEPAEFRMFADGGKVWVALVTSARWLSQSIEADLVNTGDKIEELVEEELVDMGWRKEWGSARIPYEHFRDAQKMYTFRSPLPAGIEGRGEAGVEIAAMALLGYERAFRPLGDMEAGGEE